MSDETKKPEVEETPAEEVQAEEAQKPQLSPEQQQNRKILQEHFNRFKKQMKTKSKSELIAIIWEQAIQFKELQTVARELYAQQNPTPEEASNEDTEKDS